jgi:lactate dehydrogenase-like 2-hydroxyacid dehydrogenase
VAAGSNDLAQEERLSVADGLAEDGQSRFAGRGQTVREEVMARRVGIVGIGTAMMRNLVKDGFEVVGYDIAEVAMARLVESGGIAAASPRDVAEETGILITSLPNVDAFEQVMTGQGGVASSNGRGRSSSNAALCRSR